MNSEPVIDGLLFWFTFDWTQFGAGWWAVLVIALFLIFNSLFLVIGIGIERGHDRRLARADRALSHILLLSGPPPPHVSGRPHLVQSQVVMASAPLGRLSARIRRLLGGRLIHDQRLVERARREALLRLREQAQAVGAGVATGLEIIHIVPGRHRVGVVATATALAGSVAAPSAPARVTEAVGALSPRSRREIAVALIIVSIMALLAGWIDQVALNMGRDLQNRVQGYLSDKLNR